MGGKEIEFEVERRREDRTPVTKDEGKRNSKGKEVAKEAPKEEIPDDGSWESYFQNPKTVENMRFFIMAQSFVMFLTFGLPQLQKNLVTMVDAARIAHGVVVLLALGAYSVVLFRGLSSQLSSHMYSIIETEMEKNPHMKQDYEDYKLQVEEQKKQKAQMEELENQAKKIKEQIEELSKKQESHKYVQMEGLNEVKIESHLKEPPNQSREQENRIEL